MSMEQERDLTKRQMIVCDHVSKTFYTKNTETKVIADLNITANENEFLVLFGPGQCGKTTALNVMAGLETATSGTVTVGNEIVTKPGPERGFVYQTTALFPWYTVMKNVEYGPRARGMSKKERRKKAQYYIDLVGLGGFENSFPNQLSGGMQQRVGIARAYCNEPAVLFMDEPFGHLDAQTRYLMQEEIIRIWEKERRTVVFVTNNIEEAVYLADRVIVLTNCPTRVKKEFIIDLPRPRNYTDDKFLNLRAEIQDVVDKTL